MERVNKWFLNINAKSVLPLLNDRHDYDHHQHNGSKKQLQIWPPDYLPSWRYYQEHQANHWYANEHNPMDDLNGFLQVDCAWQDALLQSFAALAIGDDKVMSLIDENKLEWAVSTQWMFADQGARETVHKIVYNRMLELACVSKHYTVDMLTSNVFVNYLMDCTAINTYTPPPPPSLSSSSSSENEIELKAHFLITMIMCERYLFAAPFLIINLMGESGFINTCVKINMQVMKDEHVHYMHALQLLHDLRLEDNNNIIDIIFEDLSVLFTDMVEKMVLKICSNLKENEKRAIMDHTRFTLYTIYVDAGVKAPDQLLIYTTTPFSVFDKNTGVDKFNLMESNSTVYKSGRSGVYIPDFKTINV
jgi:ribonucleotide reductase beta subunit family protein with ferritin-like domain